MMPPTGFAEPAPRFVENSSDPVPVSFAPKGPCPRLATAGRAAEHAGLQRRHARRHFASLRGFMTGVATGVARMIVVDPKNPKGLVWLASYPKSGNTWLRAFLYGLYRVILGDAPDEIDVNRMNDFSTDERALALYERYVEGPPEEAAAETIAAARPRVQEDIFKAANGTALMKTHNARIRDRGWPLINQNVSAGAIYVVRNPLDVVISFAHFRAESIDRCIVDMATPGFGVGTSSDGVYFVTGTWSEHVRSWTATPHPAVHVVRYEDLLDKPAESFAAVAAHVLMRPTADQLEKAIALAAFDRLRKAEQDKGFREKPETAERFFRAGRAHQWREVLTEAQVERIVADHREQMARFGYLPA